MGRYGGATRSVMIHTTQDHVQLEGSQRQFKCLSELVDYYRSVSHSLRTRRTRVFFVMFVSVMIVILGWIAHQSNKIWRCHSPSTMLQTTLHRHQT